MAFVGYIMLATKQLVRDVRKRLNLPQKALAELLGVHVMTVSRWERGTIQPPSPTVILLHILNNCDLGVVKSALEDR